MTPQQIQTILTMQQQALGMVPPVTAAMHAPPSGFKPGQTLLSRAPTAAKMASEFKRVITPAYRNVHMSETAFQAALTSPPAPNPNQPLVPGVTVTAPSASVTAPSASIGPGGVSVTGPSASFNPGGVSAHF